MLSRAKFPVNREINREFCEFSPLNSEEDHSITLIVWGFWRQKPGGSA
jgi:hypothetical protein